MHNATGKHKRNKKELTPLYAYIRQTERKRKKEYESFLEYESERLDIPEEVLAGQPTLRMIGNHSMIISGNYTIEEYSTESICLKTLKKKIHLSGEHLAIRYFRKDEIKIVGNIQTVSFFK